MSSVDYDDPRRSYRHRDRRDDREPRYVETQEKYTRSPTTAMAPDPPYAVRNNEIVRRPIHDDDYAIEEVRRDFPPPGSAAYSQRSMDRYDRARSAERGAPYGGGAYLDPRRSHNDLEDRRRSAYAELEVSKPRRRSLSRNQRIIAAVGGAALAVGGKELWDRRQADGRPVSRNPLQSAAVGAAGALAGYEGAEFYAKHAAAASKPEENVKTHVAHRGRNDPNEEYYSSDEEPAKPQKPKSRRKSIVDSALGLAGLGAVTKAATGGRHSPTGDKRSRRGSEDSRVDSRDNRHRSRSRHGKSPEGAAKYQQAAKAALLAGATEAFRVRKEPGGWGGGKGKRVLTAAIGAGGINAGADHNPDQKSKRHILEAVVGGLAGNRLINGSRSNIEDDGKGSTRSKSKSRSRSRSRSRGPGGGASTGPLAALATAGFGAMAGKKLLDRSRSRSRAGGSRRRRDSSDSYDSRSPSPKRGEKKDRHKRSKSVTDYARNGLAALGIGAAAGDKNRDRDSNQDTSGRKSRHNSGGSDYGESRRSRDMDYDDPRDPYGDSRYNESRTSQVGSRSGGGRRGKGGSHKDRDNSEGKKDASDSDSSLGASSEDEKRIKKMRGKQLMTTGLATVATIHAAHNVYQSMEKRNSRHKAVAEGDMTPDEARKLKAKATLQDVASVGIAAIGLKSAYDEIKEANEMNNECKELRKKKEERHTKRLERLQSAGSQSPQQQSHRSHRKDGAQVVRHGAEHGRAHHGDPYYDDRYEDRYDDRYYDRSDDYGPRYVDSNPYSASLPAPPVGHDRR